MELFSFEAFKLDWRPVFERAVGPHEVVVGNEKRGERNGSVEVLEPGPRPGVELGGAVEPLDELLVFAVGFAFGVEVAKADDGAFVEHRRVSLFHGLGVVGDHGAVVGGQSVGDEFGVFADGVVRRSVAVVDESERRGASPGLGKVPSADGATDLREDEPGVSGDAVDLDVGFVRRAGAFGPWGVRIDESAQLGGGRVGVVDDALVRDADAEQVPHGLGAHAGAQPEADD